MNTYTSLIDKFPGELAVVLGAGPTLYEYLYKCPEVKEFIGDMNKHIVISVNSSIMACVQKLGWLKEEYPEKRFWISNDSLCMRWSWWDDVKKSKCTKIVRNSWEKYKDQLDGFLFFEPRKTSEDIIDPEDDGLCYCCSSSSAIDISIKLGAKKIFICGLDHKTINNNNHFFQFFPKSEQPRQIQPAQCSWEQQKSVFPIHLKAYTALSGFAEYKKCKIYNCNPDSLVEVFEKIEFKDIKKYL